MLSALAITVAALGSSGCDRLAQRSSPGSVTVKLPPPRAAAPGFELDMTGQRR